MKALLIIIFIAVIVELSFQFNVFAVAAIVSLIVSMVIIFVVAALSNLDT